MTWNEILAEIDHALNELINDGGTLPTDLDDLGADLEERAAYLYRTADRHRGIPA